MKKKANCLVSLQQLPQTGVILGGLVLGAHLQGHTPTCKSHPPVASRGHEGPSLVQDGAGHTF